MPENFNSTVPKNVTITNVLSNKEFVDCTVTKAVVIPYTDIKKHVVDGKTIILEKFTPIDGTNVLVRRRYKSTDRVIQLYKTNAMKVLEAGDKLTIRGCFSAAVAYYQNFVDTDPDNALTIEVEEVKGDNPEPPTPTVVKVTKIVPTESSLSFRVGDSSKTITCTVSPDNATDKSLEFTSDDIKVATVDANTGEVTPVGVGNTSINIKSKDGGATAKVTVNVSEE